MMQFPMPICESCVRLHPRADAPGLVCDAFPDGIPDDIYEGGFDHRRPFPGDHGVLYEMRPDGAADLAVYEASV